MSSTCATACVVCDIDGFTGVNNLTAQGQGFSNFCTTEFNNMQYIAFIAGSEDLSVRVDVSNCQGGAGSLEVGFFFSDDCQNFEAITICDTNITSGESQTFTNNQPLLIGQYYYLIMDGSAGANCNWTFNVINGTTEVLPLTTSGDMSFPDELCPGVDYNFTTTVEVGASNFDWTRDGIAVGGNLPETVLSFEDEGTYQICVVASNVCDMAPPNCETVVVRSPETLVVVEEICDGECVTYNNIDFCETGLFTETIPLLSGCDSTIVIDLIVHPVETSDLNVWICEGESFFIGTTPYTQTGVYQETILTSAQCDSIVNLDLLTIECEIEGSTVSTDAICNGESNGILIFSIDQGTPPLNFTYTNIADGSITGMGVTDILVDNQITGLPAGTYQIYIQDDFGNDVVLLETVSEPSVIEWEFELSDFGGFNVSCDMTDDNPGSDGTAMINVVGGVPPYQYLWSNGQMTAQATGLTAGMHMITVTDDVGCIIVTDVTLDAAPPIVLDVDFINPDCTGFDSGEIMVNEVQVGTPDYRYSLDNINFGPEVLFENLFEGDYTLYVQDANGCVVGEQGSITAPDIPVVDVGPDLTVSLGDSIQLMPSVTVNQLGSILWSPPGTLGCEDCLDPFAMTLNDTEYFLWITSADGCLQIDSLRVSVDKRRRVYVPNIFSPNGDGLNEFLVPYTGAEADLIQEFLVYDRWGELIYSATDFVPGDENSAWNGLFKNEELNPGIYSWKAVVHFIDDEVETYAGEVSLVR
jgi:gliding motility-associated-like protein